MSPTSTPLLTAPTSVQARPPPSWQHSNAVHAPQLLDEFRSKRLPQALDAAHLTDAERAEAATWADDACLLRYLRARDYNIQHAAKMLQETFVWRVQYGVANLTKSTATDSEAVPESAHTEYPGAPPCGITPHNVENEARDGNNYVNGFDIYGRPIVYLKKRSKPRDFEANVRLLVFTMEHAISLMPKEVEQVVLILDMSNYSRANSPPMHISRETLHILTAHYPERLGSAYIVNAPAVFSFLWNIVWPFLNHVTREKIKFVSVASKGKDSGKHKNEILDVVDKSVLETAYGGEFEFAYDYNAYWKAE